ncbi:MAG: hypothetical protein J3Q66DRAFT_17244 [Benniella sp.]|nr:MAG: hypothetical protein J3Q66DRAFT_17244 [Benniella sp.]
MGIQGLYGELSKRHLHPQAIDVKEIAKLPNTTIEVDLFGAFYTTVLDIITKEYFREGVRSDLPGYQLPPLGHEARRTGFALAGIIQQTFGKVGDSITIHVDGLPCAEKTKEYANRNNTRQRVIQRLEGLQAQMNLMSNLGRFTSRTRLRDIKKCLWQLFRISLADKQSIIATLREQGCTVCACETESDFCIGSRNGIEGHAK